MIEFRNLYKSFGSQQVLRGVDLVVQEGETLALLGPSGTGKSVLIKHAIGLLEPDEGTLSVGEASFAPGRWIDPVRARRLHIAHVPEDRHKRGLVLPFPAWESAVLGYQQVDDADLIDPHRQGPPFWFQQMDAPRPQRNRIHIDVYVPHDQAEARVAAAIAAGGHVVSDENAPEWWTLADAEGNEVDVAPWPDQD